MAVLSDGDRAIVSGTYQVDPGIGTFGAVTKSDIRAAINAVDDWIVANAAAFNTAIPQPARSALTSAQKALLLEYVVRRRFLSGV